MSTQPTITINALTQELVNVKKTAFDIESFKTRKLAKQVVYNKLIDPNDIPARLNELSLTKQVTEKDAEGKEFVKEVPMDANEKLVVLINRALRRQFLFDQKDLLGSDEPNLIGNKKVVNQFVNAFRLLPQYSKIDKRDKQTEAILNFIRSNEVILSQLKEAAKASSAEEANDENEGEEEEVDEEETAAETAKE